PGRDSAPPTLSNARPGTPRPCAHCGSASPSAPAANARRAGSSTRRTARPWRRRAAAAGGRRRHGRRRRRSTAPRPSRRHGRRGISWPSAGRCRRPAPAAAAAPARRRCRPPAGARRRRGHVLLCDDSYFSFRALAARQFPRWGLTHTIVDFTDLDAVRAALRPDTVLLWAETPSNPLLKVSDIAALADIAHGADARLLVDGTFASPVLQQPLALGADIVLHSATKYLGGHGDVMGGVLC